jgi:hypothetical protein
MPNAKKGWVNTQTELVSVDLSTNTGNDFCAVGLTNAGLRRRQAASSTGPSTMNGYSVAFDATRNIAIVSGGDSTSPTDLNVFNSTDNTWSVLSLQRQIASISPTTTAIPSATTTSTPSATTSALKHDDNSPNSTGFNKSNLLAPVILGAILGALGLVGIILLICSYRRRKAQKRQTHSHKSATAAGLWLKYGNNQPQSKPGEIFLRNLEEKHGIKRSQSEARRTGWSKYFSASWYLTSNQPRNSTSTSNTARALVNETRDAPPGPYGGGWDAESRYSKTSSFFSVESSPDSRRDTFQRWSGIRWSFVKPQDQRRSSGVLGSLGLPAGGKIGAGGVNKL